MRRWGLMRWTATPPALTTPRRAVTGLPQAASTPLVNNTRRRCSKTAWSLLQGDLTAPLAVLWRAPNCTTRRAERGLPQAASTPHVIITRRRCYKTAWSLLQEVRPQSHCFRERGTVQPAERDLDRSEEH